MYQTSSGHRRMVLILQNHTHDLVRVFVVTKNREKFVKRARLEFPVDYFTDQKQQFRDDAMTQLKTQQQISVRKRLERYKSLIVNKV